MALPGGSADAEPKQDLPFKLQWGSAADPFDQIAREFPSPPDGTVQAGYAAVKTSALRREDQITEADLAEVVRRQLQEFCRHAAQLDVPQDRLFTHIGGWNEGELLYQTAVNEFSSPGWSFYKHAADPGKDVGVQAALQRSDAPHWAAIEGLCQGSRQVELWRKALAATLAVPRCRYLCIYNWEGIKANPEAPEAVRQVVVASGLRHCKPPCRIRVPENRSFPFEGGPGDLDQFEGVEDRIASPAMRPECHPIS